MESLNLWPLIKLGKNLYFTKEQRNSSFSPCGFLVIAKNETCTPINFFFFFWSTSHAYDLQVKPTCHYTFQQVLIFTRLNLSLKLSIISLFSKTLSPPSQFFLSFTSDSHFLLKLQTFSPFSRTQSLLDIYWCRRSPPNGMTSSLV